MIILKNTTVVQFYPAQVTRGVDVVIDNEFIKAVGKNIAEKYKADKIIDASNKIVAPGIVCAHNHFYSALARGILADIKPSPDFISILKNLWWRLDRALDEESLYYSGLIGALEAVKCGTTSVLDHHASPSFIKGSLSVLQKSFEQVGLRGILAYESTDRNGAKGMHDGIEESAMFIQKIQKEKTKSKLHLIESAIGGHAPFTLNDTALQLMSELAASTKSGIHLHVAEDEYDSSFSHHNYSKDILERLEEYNLLNEKSILVHGVHLTNNDLEILNLHDAFLIHNPRSNMNNSVGYMNKLHQVKNLGIGTDGIGANMFEETKFAYFKNQEVRGKMGMDEWMHVLQNGNVLLERYFDNKFGNIKEGFAADVVILDYQAPTPLQSENLAGHFLFGFSSRDVESVIINGRIVYEERAFAFDTSGIYKEAQKAAKKLWSKIKS
ncbi:MAG: chlorohydrolase [Ignavibacteria bacterium CG1_02_37_35]|nr:putative aminohydrolase SsnA [Ignavibacteria bacterium]OIO23546.1 MAG: chlorohydrolase [Ignavibacteria bacterium CG1_02_37_35]